MPVLIWIANRLGQTLFMLGGLTLMAGGIFQGGGGNIAAAIAGAGLVLSATGLHAITTWRETMHARRPHES